MIKDLITISNLLQFRQLNSEKRKVVSEALNKDVQERNIRKIHVNAQVKAMISFIESVANVVNTVVLYFTVRTSYSSLLIVLNLYMIILPYCFLMNTSHNKDRVVDNGWTNVFKNILSNKTVNGDREQKEEDHDQDLIRPKKVDMTNSDSRKTSVTILSEVACCSNEQNPARKCKVSPQYHNQIGQRVNKPQNSNSCGELITKMRENVEDENEYLMYFQKLVRLEDTIKQEATDNQFEFEDDNLPNSIPDVSCQHRDVKCKGKRSNLDESLKYRKQSKVFQNFEEIELQPRFLMLKIERTRLRRQALSEIHSFKDDEERCKSSIERLINLEEDFIQ